MDKDGWLGAQCPNCGHRCYVYDFKIALQNWISSKMSHGKERGVGKCLRCRQVDFA